MATLRLSPKEKMKIARQAMPQQDPSRRSCNFQEVNLGFTEKLALIEASRCLQCLKPTCIEGCPVGIDIKEFIRLICEGDYLAAAAKIKEQNVLPAICGRVCPQEEQCEKKCVVGKKKEPVAIGRLERFVADYEREFAGLSVPEIAAPTGKKVAVIGSGPAGLSCASDLAKQGHRVTVFEALHELGGVLIYGIPEFRLPKEIVKAEIEALKKMGVEFRKNMVIGYADTIDDLFAGGNHAVFIAVGAGLPYFLNIPGENLNGIYSANEFLTRINLMRAYQFPAYDTPILDCRGKTAVIFGGGNTAMDAVRTAKRLGTAHAYISYRRSEEEMPARKEEVEHAKEEGVEFLTLTKPVEFLDNEEGWLQGIRLQKMELREPDKSGRRAPVPIPGSDFILSADVAIIAVGNGSNPIIQRTTPDLNYTSRGNIVVDTATMQTSRPGVFAGGDIVTRGATVILAMSAGRKAAAAIHEYLMERRL
jgi:glutamate synthase (NADPH/NADH) small chain